MSRNEDIVSNELRFIEIDRVDHELLPDWLNIYECSFPPEEKVLVSCFFGLLQKKYAGDMADSHMLAAVDDEAGVVGILRFDIDRDSRIAYLWYLAAREDLRGRGLGSKCFDEVVDRAKEAGIRALVWEVEMPEQQFELGHREFAERRISFYKRHGGKLLRGIQYIHTVGPHQPRILMNIMVCPIEPISPQDAFNVARILFGEYVMQIGELTLE